MSDARTLAILERPQFWPWRVVLPLAHRTRIADGGLPVCAVLAAGHGTRVFFANVGDFKRSELRDRNAFDAALKRFASVQYTSFRAILAEWRVD
jgi:hypothetical protein